MSAFLDELKAAVASVLPDIDTVVRRAVRDEVNRISASGSPDDLLDAEASAVVLGMTPGALRRAAERGRAPVTPVRLGRRLRWRRGDLLAVSSVGRSKAP